MPKLPNAAKLRAGAVVSAAVIAGLSVTTAPATADEPSWKGKSLSIIIRSSASGGYDYYGRLMGRHMTKYLPGKPNLRAVNMPGAGGIVAANYIMNRGKKDGSELAVLSRALTIAQRLGEKGVAYDVTKMTAIGSPSGATWVWVIRGDHKVKKLSDLRKWKGNPIKFSGTGRGSTSYQRVKMLEYDGYPVNVITGYNGSEEKSLAVARGEVQATSGSYESMRGFIKDEKLSIMGRMGNHPETDGVERARDVATPEGRALIAFSAAPLIAGRPFYGPPGLDPKVTKALREAFAKAMKDPALINEAKKANRSLSYATGEEIEKINHDMMTASPKVVAAFKEMTKPDKSAVKVYQGEITGLADGNKMVTMKRTNGKVLETKVSGSRTELMIAGAKAKRGALKVGMKCEISAPGNKKEAKKITCK